MKPKIFTSIIAAFAASATIGAGLARAAEPPDENERLGVVATVATGRTIRVYCSPGIHPNVWTWAPGPTRSVTVATVRCQQIEGLLSGLRPQAKAKRDFAEALGIMLSGANSASGLGGYAWPGAGTAIASCKAIQQMANLAGKIKLGPGYDVRFWYARALAVSFARHGYWNVPLLDASLDCYPSGPMDFNLGWWPDPQPPPLGYGKG